MNNSLCSVNVPLIACFGSIGAMQTPNDRLKIARMEAKFETATNAAEAMGMRPPTYLGHENNTTPMPRDAAIRYAKFFGVSLDWLLTGADGNKRRTLVPVVGYAGGGAEVFPVDDHAQGGGMDFVPAPPGETNCVAVVVRGDSLYPVLRDGWLVFYRRDQDGVPEECLGNLCIVQVKDGPTLVKELARGSRKGMYNLTSWNAPVREDQNLAWAARLIDIRPK